MQWFLRGLLATSIGASIKSRAFKAMKKPQNHNEPLDRRRRKSCKRREKNTTEPVGALKQPRTETRS